MKILYQSQRDVDGYIEAYVEIDGQVRYIYPCKADDLDRRIAVLEQSLIDQQQEQEWQPESL